MPAFLHQSFFGDQRMKNRINVNVNQVVKILQVLAGNRVTSFVGICERIDESRQRAFEQFHERLFDGILFRAAQNRMFQNMRHARRILWRGAEVDREYFVLVIVDHRKQARTRAFMNI